MIAAADEIINTSRGSIEEVNDKEETTEQLKDTEGQ